MLEQQHRRGWLNRDTTLPQQDSITRLSASQRAMGLLPRGDVQGSPSERSAL